MIRKRPLSERTACEVCGASALSTMMREVTGTNGPRFFMWACDGGECAEQLVRRLREQGFRDVTTIAHGSGHALDDDVRCWCGWGPAPTLPEWVKRGAVFALDGNAYRVVSELGSTNRRTPQNSHFEPVVTAEHIGAATWEGLPDAPCSKAEVAASLAAFGRLPTFYADQLARAIRRVS